ncbi:gluconate 2-dehydrogenase subunit 3 family protein [Armatimonas sp.]|uniref:gluconate 2-dehydrogenase subunit 3 family protein n=1 Tax=Armatimonas sp. TaxID=1872638 RepID=UPI00286B8F51|nr:gluconate 2-dehydrogenase subunit 3 family protein [Armatimonas sp.]
MLTETQRATLAAFADVIVPPDDAPGGAEAGAVAFVEDLLARELAPHAAEYAAFLDTLAASGLDFSPEQTASPIFKLAAETVHEAYWTSDIGQRAVGFLATH